MQKWIILIIVGLIVILGTFIILNVDIETEYVPESEVEETEFRNTIITLYFIDKETGTLSKENKLIDSKELLKNPYKTIVEKLMLGPENEKNDKVISENTKIHDIKFEKGIVIINFSKEFSEGIDKEKLQIRKDAIYKTLTEFTEVTNIKVLVEGIELEI